MIEIESLEVGETDTDLARCRVETEDATGGVRVYEIGLTPDKTFDDGYLMGGRQTEPEKPGVNGPSQTAWDAAREHFRDQGWEVHG